LLYFCQAPLKNGRHHAKKSKLINLRTKRKGSEVRSLFWRSAYFCHLACGDSRPGYGVGFNPSKTLHPTVQVKQNTLISIAKIAREKNVLIFVFTLL